MTHFIGLGVAVRAGLTAGLGAPGQTEHTRSRRPYLQVAGTDHELKGAVAPGHMQCQAKRSKPGFGTAWQPDTGRSLPRWSVSSDV